MPIVSISMDRLLCSLLIAPKGKKRRTIPITFGGRVAFRGRNSRIADKPDITRENGLDERIGLIYRQLGAGPKNTTECPSFRWRAIPEKPASIMRVSETVKHVGGSTVQVYRLLRPREDLYVLRAVAPMRPDPPPHLAGRSTHPATPSERNNSLRLPAGISN
jgi:hypothetical protein